MVETQLAQAKAWEHGWLFFQMDTEGREISTRFACSHHLLSSDVSVDCNAVPISKLNYLIESVSKYQIKQWLNERGESEYWSYQWYFINCKASSVKRM
jgi:hypothetical protein